MLHFLDVGNLDKSFLEKSLNQPKNVQRKGIFPKYAEWSREDKEKVQIICGSVSQRLGHIL